jgi:hypothetical protein
MAAELIKRWRLAVLRVELDLSERRSAVAVSMSAYPDGQPRTLWTARYRPEDFGATASPPLSLAVPTELRDRIANTLAVELNYEAALWLRLVPPYGYLAAVPWEAALIELTHVPVLRVPDRLPMPTVSGNTWTAAIAVDADTDSTWAVPYIRSLIERLHQTVPAPIEVDVFADARTAGTLRTEPLGGHVRVHEPLDAARATDERLRDLSATGIAGVGRATAGRRWADWIAKGLRGCAVSALHVLLEGDFDDADPVLVVSRDPAAPVPRAKAVRVTTADLLPLFDSLGAAMVCFGAPPGRGSEVAIRMFADTVGQQRADATIFSSIALDQSGAALARAETYLADPSSAPTPREPSLFLYVQPERMQEALREQVPQRPELAAKTDDAYAVATSEAAIQYQSDATLAERYRYVKTAPSWVASSDQYLASQWAGLAKTAGSEVPTAPARGAYDQGAASALEELRAIVERHARPS